MILSPTTLQPLALALLGAYGLAIGIVFFLWLILQKKLTKLPLLNFATQLALTIGAGAVFYYIIYEYFDFDLHFYHFAICGICGTISYWACRKIMFHKSAKH